ncbi:hypothetical protein Nepgr_012782 [Nepenthes gracilis]|uniref:Uncharacterized protein n=1 Tax=Nepenthes gracilis TaxID=150966 RepID=A0AAD3SHQ9_NEPGR|nr:hypothetical protein Nepgr_012782 [Nepenthes gracilis]
MERNSFRLTVEHHLYPVKLMTTSALNDGCICVRVINRSSSQLLGSNGCGDGPVILNMIPKEQDGEDDLSCVCCCIGGGSATENAESDSDLEVVADSFTINLHCPSQCPICLKNYSLELVIINPYFNIPTMDANGNFETELDSLSLNLNPTSRLSNQNASSAVREAEAIFLSDSDEENDNMIYGGAVADNDGRDTVGVNFPVTSCEIVDSCHDLAFGIAKSSCMDLFSPDDEFGKNLLEDGGRNHVGPNAVGRLNPEHQLNLTAGVLETLTDTASLLQSLEDPRADTSGQRSNNPFSFPREQHPARPQLYLSFDSDSTRRGGSGAHPSLKSHHRPTPVQALRHRAAQRPQRLGCADVGSGPAPVLVADQSAPEGEPVAICFDSTLTTPRASRLLRRLCSSRASASLASSQFSTSSASFIESHPVEPDRWRLRFADSELRSPQSNRCFDMRDTTALVLIQKNSRGDGHDRVSVLFEFLIHRCSAF